MSSARLIIGRIHLEIDRIRTMIFPTPPLTVRINNHDFDEFLAPEMGIPLDQPSTMYEEIRMFGWKTILDPTIKRGTVEVGLNFDVEKQP